ncbi:MAG: DsbA family protein [Asticcacaulis sp.]
MTEPHYSLALLYDPFCGWCYGATPALMALAARADVQLGLMPTGLFAFEEGRPMTADFAAYAWSNDQRISVLTGQIFSAAYRQKVLEAPDGVFDSGPVTLALTAVALEDPTAELPLLKAFQLARYVEGLDTARPEIVEAVLRRNDQNAAADRYAGDDEALKLATRQRLDQGQRLQRAVGAKGVPSLILQSADGLRLIESGRLYGPLEALMAEIGAPQSL